MSMRLKKVCPQCSAVLHARKLACQCGHVFPAKPQRNERKRLIESRETDNVRKAAKRACETQEEALNRQAQNAEHMASVRESETRGKSVKRLAQNKQHKASVRACANQLTPRVLHFSALVVSALAIRFFRYQVGFIFDFKRKMVMNYSSQKPHTGRCCPISGWGILDYQGTGETHPMARAYRSALFSFSSSMIFSTLFSRAMQRW